MNDNNDAFQRLFAEVFRLKWDDEELPQYSELIEKFIFHMLDASAEVCQLAEQLHAIESTSSSDLAKSLHRFFLHAVPHLMAAGQIYDFVPRLFDEQDGVHSLPSNTELQGGPDDLS